MSSVTSAEDIIRDRAAYWVDRLNDRDVTDAEREELHDWLLADPRHASEFRAHNALIAMARELPRDLRDELTRYAPSYREESRSSVWRRSMLPFAVAAALIALIAGGWFMTRPAAVPPARIYSTHTGELRTVPLEDGSVAYLNTRTRLELLGDKGERRITTGNKCERLVRLGAGEALFDVVHDPKCPFRVVIDNIEIEVLGTRFNVYRKKNGDIVVTVVEGKIAIKALGEGDDNPASRHELGANQRIVLRPTDSVDSMGGIQETSAVSAIKWREGVLEISDEPLNEVVSELSRYTDQRIEIRNPLDPRIANIRVGGAVSVRNVRAALLRIEKLAPLRVEERDGTFTLDYQD